MKKNVSLFLCIFFAYCLSNELFAGNTCNTATPISNNMSLFESYSNLGTSGSGIAAPDCGNYLSNDFWFSVTVPPSGMLTVVLKSGTMINPASALYTGSCNNLMQASCSAEDLCGDVVASVIEESGLIPGTTCYIRVWAVGGFPNGTFEIRVSENSTPPSIPLGLDAFVGSANQTGDCVQLTTAVPSQAGCAWTSTPDDMTQTFEKALVLNFGNTDANGADGIVIGFQRSPDGVSACEAGGGNLGAGGITNSFFVEFDTWDNGGPMDIASDHAAVFVNGVIMNPINGPVALNGGNIEDGQDHTVRFKWNGSTFDYEVYFDEQLVLFGNYDIVTNCLNGGTLAHWGVIATTGGAANNHSACPYEPESYNAGEEQTVEVTICEGESYFAGGANQTTSGIYSDASILPNGCQSITNTDLTVLLNATETINRTICQDECVMIGTESFCTTGSFTSTLENASFTGCDSIVTLNLTVLDPQAVVLDNPQPTLDCNNTSVFLDGSFSMPFGNLLYQWTGPTPDCILNGATTATPEVNCPGTYTLLVTQVVNGIVCSSTTTVDVAINQIVPVADAGAPQNLDCTTGCATLDGSGSSTGGTIVYIWSGPNSFSSNEQSPEVCEAGLYILSVFNAANSCVATSNVVVTGTSLPNANAGMDMTIDCNATSVTLNGGTSDTGSNFELVWEDATGMQVGMGTTFTSSTPGTYTLVVTNITTGCSASDDASIMQSNILPIADAGSDAVIDCNNLSVTLDGSNSNTGSDYNLSWEDSSGGALGSGATLMTTTAGTYTLVVTNTLTGCSSTDEVIVSENTDLPTADAGMDMTIDCNNSTVTLDGSSSDMGSDYSLVWENSGGMPIGAGPTLMTTTAGNYILVVTNTLTGCSSTDEVVVSENTDLPTANAGLDMTIDCNNSTVTLDGSSSDTGSDYSLSWEDVTGTVVGNGVSYQASTGGTYTLIVTNTLTGCSSMDEVVVTESTTLPSSNAGMDMTIDCNTGMVTLDGSSSDTGSDYSLSWENGTGIVVGSGVSYQTSTGGTYTLVVTNTLTGCSSTDEVMVTETTNLPTSDAGLDMTIDCNTSTVTLDGSSSDTGSDYSLSWEDGAGTVVGNGVNYQTSTGGTYTLVVTNTLTGCSSTDEVIVTEATDLPTSDAGLDMIIDCNNSMVTLDGSSSDTGSDYSLSWENETGTVVGNGVNFQTSTGGTYTLVVTNTLTGCSSTDEVMVTETTDLPSSDAGMDMTIDCNTGTVTLDGSSSDTGSNYSLSWEDGTGTVVGSGVSYQTSSGGTYTLVVTNTLTGCSSTDEVVVTEMTDLPTSDAGLDMIIDCNNSTVTLDGSSSDTGSDYSLSWEDGTGTVVGSGASYQTSSGGTYTLVVTNILTGCSSTDEVVVTETTDLPTSDAGLDMTIDCNNSTVVLDGSSSDTGSDYSLSWEDGTGTIVGSGANFQTSSGGVYTLVVTNTLTGCSSTDEVVVSETTDLPSSDAGPDMTIDCDNPTVSLDASASDTGSDYSLSWEDSSGGLVGTGTIFTTNTAGTYTLIVTNDLTGCSSTDEVTITGNSILPVANAGTNELLDCNITQVTLNGTGSSSGANITYEWQNADMDIVGNEALLDVTTIGSYTLIVTNTLTGCSSSDQVVVSEDISTPNADAGSGGILSCTASSINLDASNSSTNGSFSYDWFNSSSTNIGAGITIAVSAADTYTLIVTNLNNGCTASDEVVIMQDANVPAATANSDGNITCDNIEVSLSGNGSSVGPTIEYQWLDEQNTILGNDLSLNVQNPGTYTLVVSDNANGCSSSSNVIVAENLELPTVIIAPAAPLTCDNNQVALDGSSSSSGANFSYEWFDSNNTSVGMGSIVNVAQTGNYSLVVTNTLTGCTNTDNVFVPQDADLPQADIAAIVDVIDCNNESIVLDGSNSSNGADINYAWYDGASLLGTSQTITVTTSSNYSLVVTNTSTGCSAEAMIDISENIVAPMVMATGGTINCINPSVILDGTASSQSGTTLYEWQNSQGAIISNNLQHEVFLPGNYTLIVTAPTNGCTTSQVVGVDENITTIVADAGNALSLSCSVNTVTLDGSNSSTGPSIEYQWQDASGVVLGTTTLQEVSTAETFFFIVRDIENGCADTSSVEVLQDSGLPIPNITGSGILSCFDSEVLLDGTNSTGTGTLSYEWLSPTGEILSIEDNLSVGTAGNYQLVVTDLTNACSATANYLVEENFSTPIAYAGPTTMISCTTPTVSLDGSNSSTGVDINYEWLSPTGISIGNTTNINVSEVGTYSLIAINTNSGCRDTSMVEVAQSVDLPTSIILTPDILTCTTTEVLLVGDNSTGVGPLNFSWENNLGQEIGTTPTISVNATGTYLLNVTDTSNGCMTSTSVQVQENVMTPTADVGMNGVINCSNTSYTLDGSASDQGANYQYEWQDEDAMFLTNQLTYETNNAGSYTLIVTNTLNGCSSQSTAEVLEDFVAPIAQATVNGILNCIVEQVELDASLSTSGGNLTYEWLDPSGTNIGVDPTIMVGNTGLYELMIIDQSNGCTATESILVEENITPPTASIISLTNLNLSCNQSSIIVTGSNSQPAGNLSFEWSLNNAFISNDESPEVSMPGELVLTVTDNNNGCTASTTAIITQDEELPIVLIEEPIMLTCQVEEIQLNATASSTGSEFAYAWAGPGTIINDNSLTPTVNQPGTFNLTITNTNNGCINTASITVSQDVSSATIVIANPNEFDCTTSLISIDATASSTGANYSYNWSTTNGNITQGTATLSPDVDMPGDYTLEITNLDNGCISTQTVTVGVDASVLAGAEITVSNPECFGDLGSLWITDVIGGTPPYLYGIDNETLAAVPAFNALSSGEHLITIEDAAGCQYTEIINIDFVSEIILELPASAQIELGESYELPTEVNLSANEIATIIWTPNSSLSCTDCLNPVATPASTTNYTVQIISTGACTVTANITIYVERSRKVYIPNVFSPNDDGQNDRFYIFADETQVKEVRVFKVFSRWGEEVFAAENFQVNSAEYGWDGYFKNEKMNPSVLVYYAEIEFIDGTIETYKGDVTLQR